MIIKKYLALVCVSLFLIACSSAPILKSKPLSNILATARLIELNQTYAGFGTLKQDLIYNPIITEEFIYLNAYQGRIYALDKNLNRAWVYDLEHVISSGLGMANDALFLVDQDGHLISLNPNKPELLWREFIGSQVLHSPSFSEDGFLTFLQLDNGNLIAVNTLTGKIRWNFVNNLPALTLHGAGKPVAANSNAMSNVAGDILYFGSPVGKVHALDAATGNLIWEAFISLPKGASELDRVVDANTLPLIQNDTLFIGNYQGKIAAYQRFTGTLLWNYTAGTHKNLLADDQLLYVVTDDSRLLALDQQTGQLVWQQDQLNLRKLTSPALLEDFLVVGDAEGYVHLINRATGLINGRYQVSTAAIKAQPRVGKDNLLYILTADGFFTQLRLKRLARPVELHTDIRGWP